MADFLRFNIQGVADAADELPFRIGKLIVGVSERQHIFNQFKSQPAAADFGGIADAQFCGVFEKLRQNFSCISAARLSIKRTSLSLILPSALASVHNVERKMLFPPHRH